MNGLSPLQDKCFRLIQVYIAQEKRPPTRRELCRLMDQRSTNGVKQLLDALRKKGYITLSPPRRARNIKITHPTPDWF